MKKIISLLMASSCCNEKENAPYTKEQYEFILADLKRKKEAALNKIFEQYPDSYEAPKEALDLSNKFSLLMKDIGKEQCYYHCKQN